MVPWAPILRAGPRGGNNHPAAHSRFAGCPMDLLGASCWWYKHAACWLLKREWSQLGWLRWRNGSILPSSETSLVPRPLIQQLLLAKRWLRLLLLHPCDVVFSACALGGCFFCVVSCQHTHFQGKPLYQKYIWRRRVCFQTYLHSKLKYSLVQRDRGLPWSFWNTRWEESCKLPTTEQSLCCNVVTAWLCPYYGAK